jgi:hypothetical protein
MFWYIQKGAGGTPEAPIVVQAGQVFYCSQQLHFEAISLECFTFEYCNKAQIMCELQTHLGGVCVAVLITTLQ